MNTAPISYFPRLIEDEVYFCGFASPKSYGAASYFIRHPDGNWLTDAPRFTEQLVERFKAWGGLRRIFLTHRDDVADADRYAKAFGAQRIIHEGDLDAAPDSELVLRGTAPADLARGFRAIPTSGHTRGHIVLSYRDKFLFTGDHLYGSAQTLEADRAYCWHDWEEQIRSMERLLDYRFEHVLPGHGGRLKLPARRMRAELAALIQRMKENNLRNFKELRRENLNEV